MNDKPSFYAILPATVRYDKRLKPIVRILFAEITALANKQGYCTASNSYFAENYDLATATVSRHISQLTALGYVRHEVDTQAGNVRKLYPNTTPPIDRTVNTPIDRTVKALLTERSTSNNTTSIIEDISKDISIVVFDENDAAAASSKKEPIPYALIVDALNKAAGTGYKAATKTTRTAIAARWAEGFRLEDFFAVIEDRADKWRTDEKMREFLRPPTLFSTKFESYLNAAKAIPPTANTDDSLNNATLDSDLAERYDNYITWVIEKLHTLYRSQCQIFSKSDYIDYFNCESMPGLRFALTPREKYRLLQEVHNRLDNDKRYRDRFPSALAAFYSEAKLITAKMKLP